MSNGFTKGFTKIDNSMIDTALPSMDGTAIKVYIVLARHTDSSGACWPSQPTIASKAGLQDRAVRYAIKRLSEAGLVLVEPQSGRPTVYRLLTPAPPCRPANEGAAPLCHPPRHDDAGTPAPRCQKPRHHGAAEQDIGTRHKNKTRAHTFAKPSLEEVQVFCRERSNHVDPQRFLDYYESNGWKVGRNAMKDWRAAVRTWERNGFSNGNGEAKKQEPVKYRG